MLRKLNRTAGTLLVAALAVVVIAAGGSVAAAGGARQQTAPAAGPAVAPARTIWEFKGVQLATVWATSSHGWVDVPGGSAAFSPTIGSSATFNAVFSGETSCAGDAGAWCSLRVVVTAPTGIAEFKPAAGTDFVLAAAGAPTGNQSVQRTADGFPGGVGYTIKAQVAVVGTGTLTLDDWDFTVTMIT